MPRARACKPHVNMPCHAMRRMALCHAGDNLGRKLEHAGKPFQRRQKVHACLIPFVVSGPGTRVERLSLVDTLERGVNFACYWNFPESVLHGEILEVIFPDPVLVLGGYCRTVEASKLTPLLIRKVKNPKPSSILCRSLKADCRLCHSAEVKPSPSLEYANRPSVASQQAILLSNPTFSCCNPKMPFPQLAFPIQLFLRFVHL